MALISVIVPTLNRPNLILDLVKRFNTVIKNDEEVIFVDDSLKSQKNEIAEVANFYFHYIHRGQPMGVSSARNEAVKSANGKYLIFFDDDDDFTSDWLFDFKSALKSNPDLIYCDMKLINPGGGESLVENYSLKRSTVIPGSWLIKKSFFIQVGGFDERLKFGENTELFFRIDRLKPNERYISKPNFIYKPSIDGGSKNLQNMIDSNLLVLQKHGNHLSIHVRHLYHQVIGVNFIRFRKFQEAQFHLREAYRLKPLKFATLFRFIISLIPIVAKHIYKVDVKVK